MTRPHSMELPDVDAREEALDTTKSILVQAPAGSGKTELLTTRILKLLARVDEPEHVLAITFTRPATAEMRHRILGRLEEARRLSEGGVAPEPGDRERLRIASAALENSDRRGWRLIEQPQRLNIQTIDSLCLRVAHRMPLGARLSGTLEPIENAGPLYREAARRTFDRLGGVDPELDHALRELLLLRDSNLRNCEELLANMIETRDQWKQAFPLSGDVLWQEARARLEEPFQRETRRVLGAVRALFRLRPEIESEMLELANYAGQSSELKIDLRLLAGATTLPEATPEFVEHWRCVCDLLLTKANEPRQGYNVSLGFPPTGRRQIDRMKAVANTLHDMPGLLDLLGQIRDLPPPHYSEEQWTVLRHMFTALRQAVHELDAVFAAAGAVDFVELGMAALEVLDGGAIHGVQHLLVDEFQDTSRLQHELIASLLRGWRAGDGRTLFLVGDPMQSIYMFRQADVELFNLVRENGFATAAGKLPFETLRLTANFRSNAGVVNRLNTMFATVFPHGAKANAAAVQFLPSVANDRDEPEGAFVIHPHFLKRQPADPRDAGTPLSPDRREVSEVIGVVRRHLPEADQARRDGGEFTIAILARAKSHLRGIAQALRKEGIAFRAVELEELGQQQEVLDLRSLVRALLHPMDRVAWLALLRAPWCGLPLRDLHLLCGADDRRSARQSVRQQIEARLHLLEDDPRQRVTRLIATLQAAIQARPGQTSFAAWIERTWHSLGGPACVDATEYENALAYLRLLEDIPASGIGATGETMDDRLDKLFARPDPMVGNRSGVQLMTIHKAKGLGFNVVVVPSLDKSTIRDSSPLILYLQRATGTGTELLAAPIDAKGQGKSRMYRWVMSQRGNREAEERKRLLYVACTRARQELHLIATATVTGSGLGCRPDSLLKSAWPALRPTFETAYSRQKPEINENVVEMPAPAAQPPGHDGVIGSLAATEGRSILHRLPSDWVPDVKLTDVTPTVSISLDGVARGERGQQPEASRASRVLGTTVHALFERASRELKRGVPAADLRAALRDLESQAAGVARNQGLPPAEAESCARLAAKALEAALTDPVGVWILKPHPEAQSEVSWTGVVEGVSRTLRIDRSFLAGAEPLSEGSDCLWIVDYKTADYGDAGLDIFLEAERGKYEKQLQDYALMMRLVHGEDLKLRLALYYPFLKQLKMVAERDEPAQSPAGPVETA